MMGAEEWPNHGCAKHSNYWFPDLLRELIIVLFRAVG